MSRRKGFLAKNLLTASGVPAPHALGFGFDGADVHAYEYLGGAYVQELASIPETSSSFLPRGGLIPVDSEGLVGDQAAIYARATNEFAVWDWRGAALSAVTTTAGYILCGLPAYSGGWLYWIEHDHVNSGSTMNVKLRRCRADTSSVSTIATHSIAKIPNTSASFFIPRLTSARLFAVQMQRDESITDHDIDFLFPLAGGAPTALASMASRHGLAPFDFSSDSFASISGSIPGPSGSALYVLNGRAYRQPDSAADPAAWSSGALEEIAGYDSSLASDGADPWATTQTAGVRLRSGAAPALLVEAFDAPPDPLPAPAFLFIVGSL